MGERFVDVTAAAILLNEAFEILLSPYGPVEAGVATEREVSETTFN